MTRTARRVVAAGLSAVLLLGLLLEAGCSGDDASQVSTAPSSTATSAPPGPSTSVPSTATSAAGGTGPTTSATPGPYGPGPLVPGSGQSWSDLYPDGQPPVFPLPNSSRAFPAAPAAAIGFGREFLGMDDPQVDVLEQSENAAVIEVRADAGSAPSRLTLRHDDLGWVVVGVDGAGIDTGLPAVSGADQPPGVPRTIDLSGTSPAATTMVDVVDLADGRLVARQPTGSGPIRLGDPLPQLAALVVYVPAGAATAGDLTSPRRAQVASVAAVHVLGG